MSDPWGYADPLEILADPDHPDHEERPEWAPLDFDPAHFDIEETSEAMHSPRPLEGWFLARAGEPPNPRSNSGRERGRCWDDNVVEGGTKTRVVVFDDRIWATPIPALWGGGGPSVDENETP